MKIIFLSVRTNLLWLFLSKGSDGLNKVAFPSIAHQYPPFWVNWSHSVPTLFWCSWWSQTLPCLTDPVKKKQILRETETYSTHFPCREASWLIFLPLASSPVTVGVSTWGSTAVRWMKPRLWWFYRRNLAVADLLCHWETWSCGKKGCRLPWTFRRNWPSLLQRRSLGSAWRCWHCPPEDWKRTGR